MNKTEELDNVLFFEEWTHLLVSPDLLASSKTFSKETRSKDISLNIWCKSYQLVLNVNHPFEAV